MRVTLGGWCGRAFGVVGARFAPAAEPWLQRAADFLVLNTLNIASVQISRTPCPELEYALTDVRGYTVIRSDILCR